MEEWLYDVAYPGSNPTLIPFWLLYCVSLSAFPSHRRYEDWTISDEALLNRRSEVSLVSLRDFVSAIGITAQVSLVCNISILVYFRVTTFISNPTQYTHHHNSLWLYVASCRFRNSDLLNLIFHSCYLLIPV